MVTCMPLFADVPVPLKDQATDCPHVARPLPNCYCRSLTTANIPLVIYFCRDLYERCPIYRSEHSEGL